MEPYDKLKEVSSGIYCIDGDWQQSPFRRRMTIMRMNDGGIAVHNAIRLNAEDLAEVKSLGPVRAVIAPNSLHASEAGWFAAWFPEAKLFVPRGIYKRFLDEFPQTRALDTDWPAEFNESISCVNIKGTRMQESVFVHHKSRTLVVTDLVFNMPADAFAGFEKTVMGWNDILGKFTPSRLFKTVFVSNRQMLLQSMQQVHAQEFDRVIMNHGKILERGGKLKLAQAFEARGLKYT